MALIKCPECGKEISDKANACPNCGCPVHPSESSVSDDTVVTASVKRTDVGEFKLDKGTRVATLAIAITVTIISLPLALVGIGVISLIMGIVLIAAGVSLKEKAPCICPYCGKEGSLTKGDSNYRCPACKKVSVYEEGVNQLKTVH